jgi:hypothetical protein
MSTTKMVNIGGLYQFLTILRKMLVDDLYHRVYVFWDGNLSGKLRYDFINHIKVTVVKTL